MNSILFVSLNIIAKNIIANIFLFPFSANSFMMMRVFAHK